MKRKLLSFITSAILLLSLLSVLPVSSAAAEPAQITELTAVDGKIIFKSNLGSVTAYEDNTGEQDDLRLKLKINDANNDQLSFIRRCSDNYAYNSLANESKTQAKQRFYNVMYQIFCSYWLFGFNNTGKSYTPMGSTLKYVKIGDLNYSDYGLTLTDAINVYAMVRHDVPVFYFLAADITYNSFLGYITIISDSTLETESARRNVQNKIKAYLSNYISTVNYKYSDYYKAVSLNNYICNNCEYWYEKGKPSENEYAHSIAGPILYKKGVCEAYAKLYQLILNYIGVENIYVIGESHNSGHAWNLVMINGRYYNMDTTWNDMTPNAYVLRGTSTFYRDHTPYTTADSYLHHMYALPGISSTDYNGSRDQFIPESSNFTKYLSNPRATNVTFTEIDLQWDIPAVADGVYVYLMDNSTGKYLQQAKLSHYTDTFTKTDRLAGTTYKFKLVTYRVYNGKELLSDTPNYLTVNTSSLPAGSASIIRFSGSDRYETAAKISQGAFTASADTVIIASGKSYADALAGVPLATAMNAPILLTEPLTLSASTLKEIKRLGAKNAVILGGSGAVSADVAAALSSYGLKVERIKGSGRADTAVKIAQKMVNVSGGEINEAFFVSSANYPDALSVSSIAAIKKAPILYLDKSGVLDASTKSFLSTLNTQLLSSYIIGGKSAISLNAETNITQYCPFVTRVSGSNRYDTCIKVNTLFATFVKGESVCLATGTNFPDALAGGVLAAQKASPVILTEGNKLTTDQKKTISGRTFSKVYVFGGKSAVSNDIAYAAAMLAA